MIGDIHKPVSLVERPAFLMCSGRISTASRATDSSLNSLRPKRAGRSDRATGGWQFNPTAGEGVPSNATDVPTGHSIDPLLKVDGRRVDGASSEGTSESPLDSANIGFDKIERAAYTASGLSRERE